MITDLSGQIPDIADEEKLVETGTWLATALEALPHAVAAHEDLSTEKAMTVEAFTSDIAARALARSIEVRGNSPLNSLLSPHTRTPYRDAKRRADEAAKQTEKKSMIEGFLGSIETEEKKYWASSDVMRSRTYQVDATERKGPWLKQKIINIPDNGSGNTLFRDDEAHYLAGISLGTLTHQNILDMKASMATVAQMNETIRKLGGRNVKPSLFSALNTLKELHETGSLKQMNYGDLKPLGDFANLYFKENDDLLEHFVNTVDEGPFADAAELAIVPFEAKSISPEERMAMVEISKDNMTEDNILDDITKAVASSRGDYVVEEARITDFVKVLDKLTAVYGDEAISTFRSLRPNWSPMPWYLIVVNIPGEVPRVLLETPIKGNASYFIDTKGYNWMDLIQLTRTDAQTFGAKYIIHAPGPNDTPLNHVEKLYNKVRVSFGVK